MRLRRTVLSLAAALASAGLAIAAPAASADQTGGTSTAAASLDCRPEWTSGGLRVACDYGGRYRGAVRFWRNYEPEVLSALDSARDHRAIIAHLSWSQDGRTRHASIRDAGTYSEKDVLVREGTKVHLWMCLEGIGCGAKYASYA